MDKYHEITDRIKPRNTLVLVKLILKPEEKVGLISVPTADKEYAEGEVISVGDGLVAAEGGQSETRDLKPGQRVLVKHQRKHQRPGQMGVQTAFTDEGLKLRYEGDQNTEYRLFEQNNILAILS